MCVYDKFVHRKLRMRKKIHELNYIFFYYILVRTQQARKLNDGKLNYINSVGVNYYC